MNRAYRIIYNKDVEAFILNQGTLTEGYPKLYIDHLSDLDSRDIMVSKVEIIDILVCNPIDNLLHRE